MYERFLQWLKIACLRCLSSFSASPVEQKGSCAQTSGVRIWYFFCWWWWVYGKMWSEWAVGAIVHRWLCWGGRNLQQSRSGQLGAGIGTGTPARSSSPHNCFCRNHLKTWSCLCAVAEGEGAAVLALVFGYFCKLIFSKTVRSSTM